MVLVTTPPASGWRRSPLPAARAIVTLLGVALVVAAANALNMYLERDVDALMRRTRNRPLPAGPPAARGGARVRHLLRGAGGAAAARRRQSAHRRPGAGVAGALRLRLHAAQAPLDLGARRRRGAGRHPAAARLDRVDRPARRARPGALRRALRLADPALHRHLDVSRRRVRARRASRSSASSTASTARAGASSPGRSCSSPRRCWCSRRGVGGRFYRGAAFALGALLLGLCAMGLRPMTRAETHRWARWFFRYSIVYLPILFAAMVLGRSR